MLKEEGRRKREEGRRKREKNYPYIAGVLLLSKVISPKFSYCNEQ
jgi:hypothetical protein